MVGKGIESKSSRIFNQCYVKCCKLQNLAPLNAVLPLGNGKVLDFCVDRIKYIDWPPILNALCCDLSLHSVAIRCRQPVKTVLEQIDCERLAKTVNKRAVILTNFMLTNLVEALSELIANTTLLSSLVLEGLPLKIPYLNPLTESLLSNNSLNHLFLPRCLVGDAGCLALCKALRCLPNILTLDLSGCDLTPLGASYLAELIKYQKIHRYSENWVHTLRYRLPQLDTMAGLRRITLCGNPQFGDGGLGKLIDVLADDLWIKAVDIQNCGLTELVASEVLNMMQSNTTLVVLDVRHNADLSTESVYKIRSALKQNERTSGGQVQYPWLGNVNGVWSDGRIVKTAPVKDRVASNNRAPPKHAMKTTVVKKEKDYKELLEEQLQEEILHRQQLEELNLQLVEQMKQLKQHQMRLWAHGDVSHSGSEQSFQASSRSGDNLSNSGSTSSVLIDQNTLSYIQQAFRDIYAFIKNNQCHGQCLHNTPPEQPTEPIEEVEEIVDEEVEGDLRINIVMPKKAQSAHVKMCEDAKVKKVTQSAHLLVNKQRKSRNNTMSPEMFERQMGDTLLSTHEEQISSAHTKSGKEGSYCGDAVCDSSDTLVCSPTPRDPLPQLSQLPPHVVQPHATYARLAINPRHALYSSSDEESDQEH